MFSVESADDDNRKIAGGPGIWARPGMLGSNRPDPGLATGRADTPRSQTRDGQEGQGQSMRTQPPQTQTQTRSREL